MAGILRTSIFLNFQKKFKERCKRLFIEAYYSSKRNKSIALDFDENDITSILHNYIERNPKRQKWKILTNIENHLFDNSIKKTKGFAAKFSRIDMRFANISWLKNEYIYYVEAKNLKSKDSGLKRRYIDTGIDNFLEGGKYYQCDGLLVGYVLGGQIDECISGVNKLLEKDKREKEIILNISSITYESNHIERTLEHLFLDFVN